MNANAITALADAPAEAEVDTGKLPVDLSECERTAREKSAELAQMYESLQRRERLLAASANASRLLLEAPDVMAAVPHVLRQLGEAAVVDRVNLEARHIANPVDGTRWRGPARDRRDVDDNTIAIQADARRQLALEYTDES